MILRQSGISEWTALECYRTGFGQSAAENPVTVRMRLSERPQASGTLRRSASVGLQKGIANPTPLSLVRPPPLCLEIGVPSFRPHISPLVSKMSVSLPTETPNSSFYSKLGVSGLGTYEYMTS